MNKKFLSLLLSLLLSVFVFSCGDDDNETPTGPGAGVSEFEVIRAHIDDYLSSGKAPVISAQALFDNLNDGDTSNDPVVLSVRAPADYAKGHVPTAINIPWKEIGDPDKLAALPKDRQIVTYCYTGHTGAIAATALNVMGYDATNMLFGIMAWTKDPDVRVKTPFSEEGTAHDFEVETTVNEPGTYDLPSPDYTDSDAEEEILRAAVQAYVASGKAPVISAQALFDNLNDGDTSNDPVVLSVRAPADYAKGHVPTAINIPWKEIAEEENLKKLPPDRQIVVYCYTGHTGAIATTALNLLGYDATNMLFGIMAWTKDPDVRVKTPFSEEGTAHDFEVEK